MATSSEGSNQSFIVPRFDDLTDKAEGFATTATGFLDSLANIAADIIIPTSTVSLTPDSIDITGLSNFTDSSYTPSSIPSISVIEPTGRSNVVPTEIDTLAVPEFVDEVPILLFGDKPALEDRELDVVKPTLNLDFEFPDDPNGVIPNVPTLLQLDIGNAPTIILPEFVPDVPTTFITTPGNTFTFTSEAYTSSSLNSIIDELLVSTRSDILPDDIEAKIWDRERDRFLTTLTKTKDDILRRSNDMGMARPSGSTQHALDVATQNAQGEFSQASREIAIEQAKLRQSTTQESIKNLISLEGLLVSTHDKLQDRLFASAKFKQEVTIDLFKLSIASVQLDIDLYELYIKSYEAQVRSKLSELEVYKTVLEAEQTKGQINTIELGLFTAQIEALVSENNLYRSRVQTVSDKLSAESLKVDIYGKEIAAFTSIVNSDKIKMDAYTQSVKAESIKLEQRDSNVKAFSTRIQAYATSSEVQKDIAQIDLENTKDALAKNKEIIDAYQAKSTRYDTLVRGLQQGNADEARKTAFAIEQDKSVKGLEIELIKQSVEVSKARADVQVSNTRANIDAALKNNEIIKDIALAGAQVSAQLAASALSSLQFSGSLTSSGSTQETFYTDLT